MCKWGDNPTYRSYFTPCITMVFGPTLYVCWAVRIHDGHSWAFCMTIFPTFMMSKGSQQGHDGDGDNIIYIIYIYNHIYIY